jgi:hypothetical protein
MQLSCYFIVDFISDVPKNLIPKPSADFSLPTALFSAGYPIGLLSEHCTKGL